MKRRPGLWCFISCLAVAGSVSAEDPKSGDVTVQPWTGARLNFTPNAKTAALSYYQWFGDFLQGYVQVTAPLDGDTRVAAFTGNNRLASGFGAQAQLGYDTRAAHVRRLAALAEHWRAGALRVNVIPVGVESGFFLPKLVRGTFCGEGVPCSLETQQHWTCRLFGIASCPDEKATDSLSEGVAAFVKDHCDGPKAKDTASTEGCRYSEAVQIFLQTRRAASELAASMTRNGQDAEVMLKLFEAATGTKLARVDGDSVLEAIVVHGLEVDKVLKSMSTGASLSLRDLRLTGLTGHTDFALALDGSVAFDRQKLFIGDANSPSAANEWKYDAQFGLNLTYFTDNDSSLNVRAGLEQSRNPKAKTLTRCTTVSSSEPGVTAQVCDRDALYVDALPGPQTAGYLRLAMDEQFPGKVDQENKIIPGVEARAALEGIGQEKVVSLRGTLFFTPAVGTSAARVGLAIEYAYNVDGLLDQGTGRKWSLTPFVFFAGTTTLLMGP